MSNVVGMLLLALPTGTFLLAIHHPKIWRWLCAHEVLRGRLLCVLIALERMLPLLIVNPYVVFFVYLPELTALNIFDAALPVIRFKQNHVLLAVLVFLLNYLVCIVLFRRISVLRMRASGRNSAPR